MIFDCERVARLEEVADKQFSLPLILESGGLWAGVLSSGRCALDGDEARLAGAGSLLIAAGPVRLVPAEPIVEELLVEGLDDRRLVGFAQLHTGILIVQDRKSVV